MTESTDPRRGDLWLVAFGSCRDGEPGSIDRLSSCRWTTCLPEPPMSWSWSFRCRTRGSRPRCGRKWLLARAWTGRVRRSAAPFAVCPESRLVRPLGEVDGATMEAIERALGLLLGLAPAA